MDRAWVGVDIGKEHHQAVVIDRENNQLLSRRVANQETALLQLIDEVTGSAERVDWAVDIVGGESALLLTLLHSRRQSVWYITGFQVNRASGGYRGSGKTDAKDAAVIADQARMRRDLTPVRIDDELIVELRMLVARRRDLGGDRVRLISRLHQQLLAISPALEQALDLTNRGPLMLLTHYQSPEAIRCAGIDEVRQWLRSQKVRNAAALAGKAVEAAAAQQVRLPGQVLAAELVAEMAEGVVNLDEQIKHISKLIEERLRRHRTAGILLSMPGIGALLGAEFLAATGGDLTTFASADKLAGMAGLAPMPRDSGRISGNLHRPRRYHRGLQRVFYQSALVSIRTTAESRAFYDRKRAEGKRHTQAVPPWLAAESTCCGRCYATGAATRRPLPLPVPWPWQPEISGSPRPVLGLDNSIENRAVRPARPRPGGRSSRGRGRCRRRRCGGESRQHGADGGHQPGGCVGGDQFDPAQTAGDQVAEERQPSGPVLAGGDLEIEDFAVAVGIDAGGDQGVDIDHAPALADLQHQCVRGDERVRPLVQRPGAERFDLRVEIAGHHRHLRLGKCCDAK